MASPNDRDNNSDILTRLNASPGDQPPPFTVDELRQTVRQQAIALEAAENKNEDLTHQIRALENPKESEYEFESAVRDQSRHKRQIWLDSMAALRRELGVLLDNDMDPGTWGAFRETMNEFVGEGEREREGDPIGRLEEEFKKVVDNMQIEIEHDVHQKAVYKNRWIQMQKQRDRADKQVNNALSFAHQLSQDEELSAGEIADILGQAGAAIVTAIKEVQDITGQRIDGDRVISRENDSDEYESQADTEDFRNQDTGLLDFSTLIASFKRAAKDLNDKIRREKRAQDLRKKRRQKVRAETRGNNGNDNCEERCARLEQELEDTKRELAEALRRGESLQRRTRQAMGILGSNSSQQPDNANARSTRDGRAALRLVTENQGSGLTDEEVGALLHIALTYVGNGQTVKELWREHRAEKDDRGHAGMRAGEGAGNQGDEEELDNQEGHTERLSQNSYLTDAKKTRIHIDDLKRQIEQLKKNRTSSKNKPRGGNNNSNESDPQNTLRNATNKVIKLRLTLARQILREYKGVENEMSEELNTEVNYWEELQQTLNESGPKVDILTVARNAARVISESDESIRNLEGQIEELKKKLKAKARSGDVTQEITSTQEDADKIADLKATVADLEVTIANLEQQIDGLEERLENCEKEREEQSRLSLREREDALKDQIRALDGEIEELKESDKKRRKEQVRLTNLLLKAKTKEVECQHAKDKLKQKIKILEAQRQSQQEGQANIREASPKASQVGEEEEGGDILGPAADDDQLLVAGDDTPDVTGDDTPAATGDEEEPVEDKETVIAELEAHIRELETEIEQLNGHILQQQDEIEALGEGGDKGLIAQIEVLRSRIEELEQQLAECSNETWKERRRRINREARDARAARAAARPKGKRRLDPALVQQKDWEQGRWVGGRFTIPKKKTRLAPASEQEDESREKEVAGETAGGEEGTGLVIDIADIEREDSAPDTPPSIKKRRDPAPPTPRKRGRPAKKKPATTEKKTGDADNSDESSSESTDDSRKKQKKTPVKKKPALKTPPKTPARKKKEG